MSTYAEFLARKQAAAATVGRRVDVSDVHSKLHPWQAEIVTWAVRVGRAAIWADTGLGKTFMQVEWARLSGDTVLIVAPLAVCAQTVREAAKLGVEARYVRDGSDITGPGVWVTSYEMVERFDPALIDAVVLDEASLLKQSDGKTRTLVTKPKIASFGMNYQHCARMAFVGLSDSFESYYQSIRRCYRYGQHRVVHAHIVLSELEQQIAANVARKEREATSITAALVAEMRRSRAAEECA